MASVVLDEVRKSFGRSEVIKGVTTQVADAQAQWPLIMATTMLAMLPPVVVVILMQRWFVKGLIEPEK